MKFIKIARRPFEDRGKTEKFVCDPRIWLACSHFRENKPETIVFSHRKQAFWACFRENCLYNFGHWRVLNCDFEDIANNYYFSYMCSS
jgi:hypothetical protein